MESGRTHLIAAVAACALAAGFASAQDSDLAALASGNNAFACDLYARLRSADGNLFFSPYSISTALGMTYAGARGETAEQIARTFHFDLDQGLLHPAFAGMEGRLDAAQKKGTVQLLVANSLWPHTGYPFLPAYVNLLKEHYRVIVTPVDYVRAAETARQMINAWVEEKTKNRIKDLIPAGALNALTRLVLVNAIYFKGDWAEQFDEALTQDAPFRLSAGERVNAPLMNRKGDYHYAETDLAQVLELPYVGNDLSMIVLLPRDPDGLPALEAALKAKDLGAWIAGLRKREVVVFLPKFKMTSQFNLAKTLAAMGMPGAFGGGADFSGMDGTRELFISEVIHKAFVEVNEEGTEAAAATAVVMRMTAVAQPPPTFRADHPFVFLIRERATNAILFMGRVANPAATE
ncbi:MAG: serpin family protein [Kiritimatiellae bacterium]|nr:serpin family protein [Kiritimatiellia bacterium]